MATRFETRSEWRGPSGVAGAPAQTLAGVAQGLAGGGSFSHAVRDFLDEFTLAGDPAWRQGAIAERPQPTGDPRHDAYLGALAEHLAAVHDLDRPAWSIEPDRFLDRFWFVSETKGFRAISIAQAPAAFRRRGVFIPERSLHRV